MTWLLLVAIILGILGLLKLLRADFMFRLYAVAAGIPLAVLVLGLITCRSLGVLCNVTYFAAKALDALQTPLAIAIAIVFGGIEREARKRKQKRKIIAPGGADFAGQEGLVKTSMYCEFCGKEVGDKARFCRWCGKPIN
ncbi:MAG: zinc ribbon domain-containing protein [Acidobacteria bacterium]|nr:zinc ribbon domain-containing protein [Acidobacteriota bacterium]